MWSGQYLFHRSQQPGWRKVEKADDAFVELYLLGVFKGLGLNWELMNVVVKVIQVTLPHGMAALWYYIYLKDLH